MDRKLTINVLGHTALLIDGQPLKKFRSRKAIALIIYLACTQADYQSGHQREHLADLLWDASSTKQSLSNLRTVLSMLRRQLVGYIAIEQNHIGIEQESRIEVDFLKLREGIKATPTTLTMLTTEKLLETLEIYQGEFVQDFVLPNAPRFSEWAKTERRLLREQVLGAYQKVAVHQSSTKDFISGITTTNRWLQYDPVDEAAHAMLIEMLAKSGRRGAAIAQYRTCKEVLREELDIEPAPEIQRLVSRIQSGEGQ